MYQGTMKCGTPFEITLADSYNGPDNRGGGLQVNYAVCWYRVDGGEWFKSGLTSFATRTMLQASNAADLLAIRGE